MPEKAEPTTQPSKTPSVGKAGTPTETKTFTQEDIEQARRDGRNAALGEIGKSQKEAARARQLSEAAEARVNQMLREQEARELEAARDDPAQLIAIRERQKRQMVEAELAAKTQELGEKTTRLTELETKETETSRAQITREVADRFGVDPALLAKLARLTDGSRAAIEDEAKTLPRDTSGKPPLKPDSGGAVGGSLSYEALRDRFIKDPRSLTQDERATLNKLGNERRRA